MKDGVALAGAPAAPPNNTARIIGKPKISGNTLTFKLMANGPGTAHVFAWSGTESVASDVVSLKNGKPHTIQLLLNDEGSQMLKQDSMVLIGFDAGAKGTASLGKPVSK